MDKIILGILVLIVVILIVNTNYFRPPIYNLGVSSFQGTIGVTSSTNVTVTSTARQVLGIESAAQFRCYSNASGTEPIYLSFGTSTGASPGRGFAIQPSTTVWFSGDDLWAGAVWASAGSGTNLSMCQL